MFIQQPFRIQAEPRIPQDRPVLLDSAVRMYYTTKVQEFENDVVKVHRVDVVNPVLVDGVTQLELMLSIEADTIEFFDHFIQSFIREEETNSMILRPLR